ncbi:MAG: hypothetical protein JO136_11830 [Hyphomicrobiales bacterium]|nr:hypothetical protein [Hyphomicrobiales bacterium]MBV9909625.1 hypothetical protein [Hyphomicrobiales bacterium]
MARTIRAAGGRKGMMADIAYGCGLFTGSAIIMSSSRRAAVVSVSTATSRVTAVSFVRSSVATSMASSVSRA